MPTPSSVSVADAWRVGCPPADPPAVPLLKPGLIFLYCRGARMRTHTDAGLIVITISGDIDASNVEALSCHARGLVPDGGALIVDLSEIDFIGVDGLRALLALNSHCARTTRHGRSSPATR